MLIDVFVGAVLLGSIGALGYFAKKQHETLQRLAILETREKYVADTLSSLAEEVTKFKKTLKKQAKRSAQSKQKTKQILGKETVKELLGDLEDEGILSKSGKHREKDIIIVQEFIHHTHSHEDLSREELSVMLDEARELVKSTGIASARFLETKLYISEADAEVILDRLEEEGIVGPPDGSSHRNVYIRE